MHITLLVPSGSRKLSELSFPKPILPSNLPDAERVIMREWTSVNGDVVRQRSVRAETTVAKAGNLPERAYQQEVVPREMEKEVKIRKHKRNSTEKEQ